MFYNNRSAILLSLTRLPELDFTNGSLVDHIVDCIVDAVEFSKGNSPSLYRPSYLGESSLFKQFISRVLDFSNVPTGTVLIALAYVDQMKLRYTLDYGSDTYERVFIGSLILANQFIRNDAFATKQLDGYHLLFDATHISDIEMRFLFDFGFGALTIEESAILSLYETLVEIVEGTNLCRRAYCQSHDHSHTGVTLFCPPHGRADLPATKMRRQTWWRKLLYRSHFSRAPISQGVTIICPDHSVSFF